MKNIFEYAKCCLQQTDIEQKLHLTIEAYQLQQQQHLSFHNQIPVESIELTRFPERPLLLYPREMPKRKLNQKQGIAALFHALAHIEWMAIYLAWDIIFRFRDLPQAFYQDWLTVAYQEAQHFDLIRQHLRQFNLEYGDLPAHAGLWEHAQKTANHLLARLALVPRCMEARGLDVTPTMIDKFMALEDQKSVDILTQILNDEIGHVAIGSYWFTYFCQQQQLEPEMTYQQLLQQFYKGRPKGPFNYRLRQLAGFSISEIQWLEHYQHQ